VIRIIGENVFVADCNVFSSSVEAFLTADAVKSIFDLRMENRKQIMASVIYFELWKSFARQTSVREAARWAAWWNQTIDNAKVKEEGHVLSVLIAHHVGRDDVLQTLCHLWGKAKRETRWESIEADYRDHQFVLFDGWPPPATQ
jgi:hypothetical protein